MSMSTAERLQAYKAKMDDAGFKRLSVYIHPDLVAFLGIERHQGECGGRMLERLLLGTARDRPSPPNFLTHTRPRARVRVETES